MSMHFREIAEKAAEDGIISAEEILELRRAGWSDGKITPREAEAIFVANDALNDPTNDWSDFFVEAIGEFIVNTLDPKGYVTDEQADWLITKISHDGKTESLTELEVLVRVLERSKSTPKQLHSYALEQIECAMLNGGGPSHLGSGCDASGISEPETRLLRRFVFASGGDRPAAVSRAEAEMLFRIKDAALDRVNAPDWKRLFVQGAGNYIMGFAAHTSLTRERAAELQSFVRDHKSSVGGFFGRMAKSTLKENFYGVAGEVFGAKESAPSHGQRADEAREVDDSEQMWLEDQIDSNGEVDEYDRALLAFLEEESGFTR
ncbi:MAG: hypothetical protein KUG65_01420 [Sphingomonadaceae bacterium]|nr:hypothetical protein [Sphingomonadaceae bacterium]